MKILLEGAFGESNFGDDLLLVATIRAIHSRWPNSEIIVNARNTSRDEDYLDRIPGISCVSRKWIHSFRKYDLKVYAGGTQFYSYPKTKNVQVNFKISELFIKFLWKLSRTWNATKPNAYLGVGIGPFYDGNEDACRRLLSNGDFLSVRDDISSNHLQAWDISNFVSGSDICFQSDWWLNDIQRVTTDSGRKVIGIIARDFNHDLPGKDYLLSLSKFMEQEKISGKSIQCFAFSEIKDAETISYFESLGIDVAVWRGELSELKVYLEKIASCSVLISARYHGVVIGSILGIPTIGVEVDPKVRLACDALGKGSLNWPPPFRFEELDEMVTGLAANSESIQKELAYKTGELREKTQLMYLKFVDFVERRLPRA